MLNKFYCVLFLYLISFMLLNSQEAYNKYFYKSKVTYEESIDGITTHLTESEKQWVKEWKQQLKHKANFFKERTDFKGDIVFQNDRASLKCMIGILECSIVVDSISAISSANYILDDIIELVNIPRNQLRRVNVRYPKLTYNSGWVVIYEQCINRNKVIGGGLAIRFKEDGTLRRIDSSCYPELSSNIVNQYTKNQIETIIIEEFDLSNEITFKRGKYYYRVGNFGELTLMYETLYGNIKKARYSPSYRVIINALTGEIISHSEFDFKDK